jgi:hypothetical protein
MPFALSGPLGDDAQIAKSGELSPKALVRVDAIRKACLTNLDCAQDGLFPEVEHPVYERPVCKSGRKAWHAGHSGQPWNPTKEPSRSSQRQ